MSGENMDPSYMGEGMYRENIIDHYKHPHNQGVLEDADAAATEHNPVCGDVITISIRCSNAVITDIRFMGKGCAISQAATSMLTDAVKGKPPEEAQNIKREDIAAMLGIAIGPVRTKCATLGLSALREALRRRDNNGKVPD
jgi:nitrogen fixation protein NifU and related proteins